MYEAWLRAEAFYTLIMPILIIILLVLLIVYILVYSYTEPKKKARQLTNRLFTVVVLLCGGYFLWGHARYNDWIEQNNFINPGIREFNYILGMQSNEDASMVRLYRRSDSLPQNLSVLEMYEGEQVKRSFDYPYLGMEGSVHYFAYGDENQYVFTYRGDINWTEDERAIVGWEYQLVDEQFEQIGFVNAFDTIFDSLSLPQTEQKGLESLDTQYVVPIEEMFAGWIFGSQFY